MTHLVAGIPSDGAWFRAQGGTGEQPTMIRARQDLLTHLPTAQLPTRIVLSWKCRTPLDIGLPSKEDYEEMSAFEETLLAFTGEGALLAFVFTRGGIVEYTFYTNSSSWFTERLNEALADKPLVPIEIAAVQDPEWAEYRSLMQAVGRGEPAA